MVFQPIGNTLDNQICAQIFEMQLTRAVENKVSIQIVSEIAKVGSNYYKLQKVFGAGETPETNETEEGRTNCCICLADSPSVVAMPCRHLILCRECAESFRLKSSECPLCREQIKYLIDTGTSDLQSQSVSNVSGQSKVQSV